MIELLKNQIPVLVITVVLVGLCQLIFRSAKKHIDLKKAVEQVRLEEPDFYPELWMVDEKSGKVLGVNGTNEIVIVQNFGANLVVRRVSLAALKIKRDGPTDFIVASTDRAFRRFKMSAPSEPDARKWESLISTAS
jgi:hypothetical protein